MPLQKPIPQLMKPVQKGQKVTMGVGTPLTALKVCFGWNSTNADCDVDVSAFMLGPDGKVVGDEWFVFYGQTNSPDNSTTFQMDNGADREIININLQTLNPAVKKIVFVLTINEAVEKRLHFGMMKDAYVRIMNPYNNTELVSFQMTDYYSNVISMMIGEVYQHNGAWKFNAVGNGVAKDLLGLCELYGVQVID
ncbi:MAG: TerD family protein [Lachnospiraceae bacterium]|nr:TerD family protein [Lachnospiraceae bacterium]